MTAGTGLRNQPRTALGRWLRVALGSVLVVGAVILLARWLTGLPAVAEFLRAYPGTSSTTAAAEPGIPAWIGWQHFFNAFLVVLIIKSGWEVRTQARPPATWTRKNTGLLRTRRPPAKISLTLWLHLVLDAVWLLNGAVFVVLLVATGQARRIVPQSWDVIPNALSAALQYASLDWPLENGWVNYNSLQVLAYFTTVFIAAPLAALTGLRMSRAWPQDAKRLNSLYRIELARALHLPVMMYFAAFIVVHVALVLTTGALANLNHMYASRDAADWVGFGIFAASLTVMAGAWLLARPLFLAPIASLMGRVGR